MKSNGFVMTENRMKGYQRVSETRQREAEKMLEELPECRIRITDVVGVMPQVRPKIGEILTARIIKTRYGGLNSGLVPAYWVQDKRFGNHGMIIYAEECEVLK